MCDMLPTHPPLLLLLLLLVVLAKSVIPGDLETVVAAASASRDESQVIQGGTVATDEDRLVVGRSLVAVNVQQNIVQGNPMLKATPWEKGEQDEEESEGKAPAKAKSLILLDEDTAHQHNYVLEETAAGTPVRKCCELGFFFSLQTQQCEAAPVNMDFEDIVQSLRQPDASSHGGVQLVTGPLLTCPDTGRTPVISEVVHGSHLLLEHGFLRSEVTGHDYDHDHYCLELAAPGPDQLEASIMVAAQCQPWPTKILTRKCCALDQYYDHALEECRPKLANMSGHEELVREFIRSDAGVSSIKVQTGTLRCDRGAPRIVVADQAFLDASSQLCERLTGRCHTTSSYCVEYLWAAGDTTKTALAFVCPVEAFHKCCPKNYLLTETGCALAGSGDVSARMRHLMEMLDPHYGFPTENGGQLCVRDMITPDDVDVQWWISKNGYLSVNTRGDSHDTMRYCVDDYLGPSNKTQTVTILCQDDLEEALRVHLSQEGMVNKCCPHGHYFSSSTYTCRPDDQGLELLDHPLVQAANITKLIFTSFLECQASGGYHLYHVDPDLVGDDHALLSTDHMLEVVGLESGCVFTRHSFPRHAYCLDYTVNGSDRRPGVLVCAGMWQGYNLHTEKYDITSILLGVSCAALFGTAFSLISTRVRRGLVTVKKVNTLAGRILLSYVFSYLVGFLLLMVNMKVQLEERSSECQVIAWLLIFFLLAAFQWNTSICLESLLLTLHVETSETLRYLYHSLWAWGLPAFIASLALTLDHYRQSLPCSVITPKVGLYRCFFSDATATLVYFYTPMLIGLVANVVLLLLSRHLRAERLRKLECGLARNKVSDPERERTDTQRGRDSGKAQTPSSEPRPAQSGLRTHQTRNVWLESVKLVVWSGVTWLLEVVSFVISKYMVTPSESWYDYLWYVPSSVNALLGVGIFVILVLTPERRVQIRRSLLSLVRHSGVSGFAKSGKGNDSGSISVDVPCRGVKDSAGPVRAATSPSSQPSDGDGPEQDVGAGAGCRRHSSLGVYVTHL